MNRLLQMAGILIVVLVTASAAWSQNLPGGRFFFSGDGRIHLKSEKNGAVFNGRYKNEAGQYDAQAIEAICKVFGAPFKPEIGLSLRLVEYIDYLEDLMRRGARVVIVSGYRDPEYNAMLNSQGKLAAKGSLHQYGMAADLRIEGVSARRVWNTVRKLTFGGAGYYQGDSVHVDVGPARFWNEQSSGVGTGISDDNKLIALTTDYDRYLPGETLVLRFTRMTAFPIGVARKFYLQRENTLTNEGTGEQDPVETFEPVFPVTTEEACPKFGDIGQMAFIRAGLPVNLAAGRYVVRATFCENPWKEMPGEVVTPAFEVVEREMPR